MDTLSIREIQEALRYISFYDPRLSPLAVDGIYSPQTEQAVRIFQTLNDLEVTGTVDKATWEELRDSADDYRSASPLSVDIFPHPDYILRPNETAAIVSFIQLMLQELSAVYANIPYTKVSGIYDDNTVEQIRNIQALHRLIPDGNVNLATWNVLVTLYRNRSDTAKR